jgi:tetratricopeptide (TPR) repeat protein
MTDLFLGRLASAESNIATALALFKELGDRRGEAWAQQNMAWISTSGGDSEEAKRRIGESVRLFQEIGDLGGLGWAYGLLGWVRLQEGYLEEADELAHRVIDRYEGGGDVWAEGMMDLLLATTSLWLGRTDEAVERAAGARERFAGIRDSTGELRSVATLARSLLATGQVKQARELLSTASAMSERELDQDGRTVGHLIAAGMAVQLGESSQVFDLGELLEPTALPALGNIDLQVPRGIALLQLGRVPQARKVLRQAHEAATTPGSLHASGAALALAEAADGDAHGALAVADRLAELPQGTYLDRIGTAHGRAFALLRLGRHDEAATAFDAAVAEADGTGDRLNQALTRLARARGLEAAGEPGAPAALADAEARLTDLGLPDTEWDAVFRRAAGLP